MCYPTDTQKKSRKISVFSSLKLSQLAKDSKAGIQTQTE